VIRSLALNPDVQRLDALDSGEPSMDAWLSEQASGAEARRVARTFVWTTEEETVTAYYSLTGHRIVRDELPKSVGRGSPSEIPAVLLARLALDKSLHGLGHGGVLLAEALERIVVATQIVAARIVVVDALHERAASFYEHFGFTRIPGTLRLVQKVSDVAAALKP
jgi:GNAT superfamily N-acetyltransferase